MFNAKIRSYGWYCTKCREHKPIDKVWVARVEQGCSNKWTGTYYANYWTGIICFDCNTELTDCCVAKKYYPMNCEACEDRFQCFTKSEAQIEKPLRKVLNHQVSPKMLLDAEKVEVGIKSYTGKIYDKLEPDNFCAEPDRDDCNHSYMRANYNGETYKRCEEMKYDKKEKKWYCRYGSLLRGT